MCMIIIDFRLHKRLFVKFAGILCILKPDTFPDTHFITYPPILTEEERSRLKEIIREHIAQAEADIAELNELVKPVSLDASIGRISRMDAINNKTINEDALRKTKKRLQKLENIITIADTKEFGKCVKCGTQIPFGRLEFMPESRSCVQCARR